MSKDLSCMKQSIAWTDVPSNYGLCIHRDCPLASHYLRAIAFQLIPEDERWLRMINPLQCTKTEGCPHYRSDEPVVFAYGFTQMKERLLPRQFSAFMHTLQGKFGRMGYFRRRSGESATTPAEQAFIRQVLADIGAPSTCDFDDFRKEYAWND